MKADMIDQADENIVFLLATPRAGSTLLSVILDNHSRILCPSEPWFLLSLRSLYDGYNGVVARYDQRMADLAFMELTSRDDFVMAARAFARSIYDKKLSEAQKTIFVDKTPRYYHILPFIDQLFPKSKKIWLQRNPLDVAASFISSWKKTVDELVGNHLSPYSFDLTLGLSYLSEYFQGQQHVIELRYEDLVADPPQVLGRLFAFLGLPNEQNVEHYGDKEAVLNMFRQSSMGDKNFLNHTKPHADSIGRWTKVLSDGDVQRIISCIGIDMFERMGYSDTIDELSARGYRFPERSSVEARQQELRLAAESFSTALFESTPAVDFTATGDGAGAPAVSTDQYARLVAQLAATEADRKARLDVIERLNAKTEDLLQKLAASEADRAARLEVIRRQEAESQAAIAQLAALQQAREADRAAILQLEAKLASVYNHPIIKLGRKIKRSK